MAFETSEAFYAGLSTFKSSRLELAKTNQDEFNSLYQESIDAFQASALDGAGNATKTGMITTIASKTREGRGAKGLGSLYSDLASQISAVLGTRASIGQDGPPSAIYLNQPVGIGEHSDVMGTIDGEINSIAQAHEKIEIINHYFLNR